MHGNEFSHVSQTNSGKRRASQTTEGLRWGGGDSEKWGLVTSVSVQVPSSPSKCRGEVSLSSFNHCDTHLYKMQKIQNIHAEESDWKLISCSNFPVNSCYFFSFIIFFFFLTDFNSWSCQKSKPAMNLQVPTLPLRNARFFPSHLVCP